MVYDFGMISEDNRSVTFMFVTGMALVLENVIRTTMITKNFSSQSPGMGKEQSHPDQSKSLDESW